MPADRRRHRLLLARDHAPPEGDFDNSRYWFNKVGDHPAISRIGYDPRDFIGAVEERHAEAPADLVALQRQEWETLFSWCATEYSG